MCIDLGKKCRMLLQLPFLKIKDVLSMTGFNETVMFKEMIGMHKK